MLFGCSDCPSFGHRSSFGWLLCPFDVPPLLWLFKFFLLSMSVLCFVYFFGTARCPGLTFHLSCPSPRIGHFSKDLSLLLLENWIRNQDLGTKWLNYCYFSVCVLNWAMNAKHISVILSRNNWKYPLLALPLLGLLRPRSTVVNLTCTSFGILFLELSL